MTATEPYPFVDLAGCRPKKTSGDPRRGGSAASETRPSVHHPQAMRFTAFGPTSSKEEEPSLVHTAEDLARAVEDARRRTALEVEADVRSTMAEEIEQRRCDMLAAVNEQLGLHKSAYEQELAHLAEATQRLAILLARAIVPRAVDRCPLVDITESLKSTLARLVTEPSMEMRLPSDLVDEGTRLDGRPRRGGWLQGRDDDRRRPLPRQRRCQASLARGNDRSSFGLPGERGLGTRRSLAGRST